MSRNRFNMVLDDDLYNKLNARYAQELMNSAHGKERTKRLTFLAFIRNILEQYLNAPVQEKQTPWEGHMKTSEELLREIRRYIDVHTNRIEDRQASLLERYGSGRSGMHQWPASGRNREKLIYLDGALLVLSEFKTFIETMEKR